QPGDRARHPGGGAGEGHRAAPGRPGGLSGDRRDAAERLHQRLVARRVRPGPRAAERRHRAVDEARIFAGEDLVAETELFHRAGPEVLDENVGRPGQPPHQRYTVGSLEVDADAALVPVVDQIACRLPFLVRGPRARFVTDARVLHLDDVGAEVAEQRAAIRTGQHAGEIHDTNAVERERSGGGGHRRYYYTRSPGVSRLRPLMPGTGGQPRSSTRVGATSNDERTP